ncbi:polysaccharide deacetylase family protein [Bacillus marasmi]|uniref:polysaccharide deacetylase family protein n=1 Tax=Bacillus marasmi TaxID=1926279 RepID=UPI0011C6F455|nr:polysaccharide deacetylase family protein [Bacillus marasmi]
MLQLLPRIRESKLFKPLRSMKTQYIAKQYWKGVIQKLKSQNQSNRKSSPFRPGIAFSFDDSFRVHDWFQYGKDLFGYYDVKVTFNINAFHHFEGQRKHNQAEIDMLLELQADGHEIAHHGYSHQNAKEFADEHGCRKWIEAEIEPLFDWMDQQSHSITKEKFKMPVSFAYPYTLYSQATNAALVPAYFKVVRGGFDRYDLPSHDISGYVPSICIDQKELFDFSYFKQAMKLAKETGTNLIIMCHSILPNEVNWDDFGWGEEAQLPGQYRTAPKLLQAIIKEARKLDMAFYTTAELAGIATFIDRNLEAYLRNEVLKTSEKWIKIVDLHHVKELDLRHCHITNLDGIQYFINLEKLYLGNHHINDLSLLNRLPKLSTIL